MRTCTVCGTSETAEKPIGSRSTTFSVKPDVCDYCLHFSGRFAAQLRRVAARITGCKE